MITTTLPPLISMFFDSNLLLKPIPRDDSKTLWNVYLYIKDNLIKKSRNNPKRMKQIIELEKQFLELYERSVEKEKELEKEKRHHTKEPFYHFKEIGRDYRWLFRRLKYK